MENADIGEMFWLVKGKKVYRVLVSSSYLVGFCHFSFRFDFLFLGWLSHGKTRIMPFADCNICERAEGKMGLDLSGASG